MTSTTTPQPAGHNSRQGMKQMDALQLAKGLLIAADGAREKGNLSVSVWQLELGHAYAAIAQAEAAQRQAAALERIASAVHMDNDLTLIDGLYAIVEALTRGTVLSSAEEREYTVGAPDPREYDSEAAYLRAVDKYNDFLADAQAGVYGEGIKPE